MNTRLIHDHAADCSMVHNSDLDNPWFFDPEDVRIVWRDSNGLRGRDDSLWLQVRCTDQLCPASAIANIEWLLSRVEFDLKASNNADR